VVLSQFNRPWKATTPEQMGYSIRTSTHRYTRWIDWGTRETVAEELYDYSSPDSAAMRQGYLIEQVNVVYDPVRVAVRDRLRQLMDQTMTTPPPASQPADTNTPARKKKKKQS
jgi:hypothetical protein